MALIADKIVGFDSRIFFPNHYYWGSSVLVHPRFRKMGLAKRLIGIGEKMAAEFKINKIKTAVMFDNILIFKKMGFSALRPWHILGIKLDAGKNIRSDFPGIREAVDSDLGRLEQFLSKSDYFILSNKMYAEDLIWYPLDKLWFSDLIKQGKVLLNEDKSGIKGLAVINKKSLINPFPGDSFSIVEIGYFDGDCVAILDFIQEKYCPDFLRIYSADGIPLEFLPAEIKNGYFVKFNSLFGGLSRLNPSEGKLYFTSVTLMQKVISN